ncbi:MAG: hypothetical protein JXR05_03135 [Flavobacteriaceae bacterium]
MKNQALLFLALITLVIVPASSQSFYYPSSDSFPSTRSFAFSKAEKEKAKELLLKSISGSPFIDDNFVAVKINEYDNVLVGRYDAFNDHFEVKMKNSKTLYVKKKIGNKVTLLGSKDTYGVFRDHKNDRSNFYKILKEGKVSLLIKEKITFQGRFSRAYTTYNMPVFKRSKNKLYISFDGKRAEKIPTNKKQFLQLFPKNSDQLIPFIKKNKLNVRRVNDLEKIIDFYNSL